MKTVIFYQARTAGVHDLLNFYWNGVKFVESATPIPFSGDFQEEYRAAAHYLDIRYNAGLYFFGSENLMAA